jgi:hypothetical protein
VPVLAVGSNAAIAQMQAKFQAAGISCAMPLTWARVTGIRVGAAAIVSRWGYIPAAPVFEPGVITRLAVNWLDPEQLRALDETETGYERRLVDDGDATRVELESGERLCTFGIYVSTSGVLADPDGRRPMDLPGQEELIRQLLARGDRSLRVLASRGVAGFLRAASDHEGRARLVEALRSSAGIAVLTPPTPTRAGELGTYDAARGGLAPPAGVADAIQVARTPEGLDRGGQQAVVVPTARWMTLGQPSHVVVRSAMDPQAPAVVGRVLEAATGDDVQVDQSLRNGLGVEIGEYVTLEPASVDRHRLADALLGTPQTLLCRVQAANLVTSERRAALLTRLGLELVGVDSGDRVVIEGLPRQVGGGLAHVTVRAFEAPDDTVDRRERISGGGFQHRYPSARDALGVHPDLPWIFVDRDLRNQLGLTRLAVVRVRASRRDQLTKELREMLLVLVIALIGLVQVVDVGWAWVAFGVVVAAAVAGVVGMRLRSRLGS